MSDDFDSSHQVDLDGIWTIKFDPSGTGSGSKVGGIILKDTRWGTVQNNEPG